MSGMPSASDILAPMSAMIVCRRCNTSGRYLLTNSQGLCKACERTWTKQVEKHGQTIDESMKIIQSTRTLNVRLSHIRIAMRSCQRLHAYEQRNVETITPPPRMMMHRLDRIRTEIIQSFVCDELANASARSQEAKSQAGKISPFDKILRKIVKLRRELSDGSEIELLERKVRTERNKAEWEGLVAQRKSEPR